MSILVLDGTTGENQVSPIIGNLFATKPEELQYFKLEEMHILTCTSCGSCGYNTPGDCVQKDDMTHIFSAAANCQVMIFLTPITFGGYSSHLKKALDRFMVLGLPLFIVQDGHFIHPIRYPGKFLLGIGLSRENHGPQEESFKTLVARNSLNIQYPHQTLILKPSDSPGSIKETLVQVLSANLAQNLSASLKGGM